MAGRHGPVSAEELMRLLEESVVDPVESRLLAWMDKPNKTYDAQQLSKDIHELGMYYDSFVAAALHAQAGGNALYVLAHVLLVDEIDSDIREAVRRVDHDIVDWVTYGSGSDPIGKSGEWRIPECPHCRDPSLQGSVYTNMKGERVSATRFYEQRGCPDEADDLPVFGVAWQVDILKRAGHFRVLAGAQPAYWQLAAHLQMPADARVRENSAAVIALLRDEFGLAPNARTRATQYLKRSGVTEYGRELITAAAGWEMRVPDTVSDGASEAGSDAESDESAEARRATVTEEHRAAGVAVLDALAIDEAAQLRRKEEDERRELLREAAKRKLHAIKDANERADASERLARVMTQSADMHYGPAYGPDELWADLTRIELTVDSFVAVALHAREGAGALYALARALEKRGGVGDERSAVRAVDAAVVKWVTYGSGADPIGKGDNWCIPEFRSIYLNDGFIIDGYSFSAYGYAPDAPDDAELEPAVRAPLFYKERNCPYEEIVRNALPAFGVAKQVDILKRAGGFREKAGVKPAYWQLAAHLQKPREKEPGLEKTSFQEVSDLLKTEFFAMGRTVHNAQLRKRAENYTETWAGVSAYGRALINDATSQVTQESDSDPSDSDSVGVSEAEVSHASDSDSSLEEV